MNGGKFDGGLLTSAEKEIDQFYQQLLKKVHSSDAIQSGAFFDLQYAQDSSYDAKMGECLRVYDIFGLPVKTWLSYYNFKVWFDWVASNVPGLYINCTEGGCFGAYQGGNILAVKQMELKAFLDMINMSEHLREQALDPENAGKKVLF
jgi:hypothetical protein